jgi:hypothetical protein
MLKPGEKATITAARLDQELELTVVPGKRPPARTPARR